MNLDRRKISNVLENFSIDLKRITNRNRFFKAGELCDIAGFDRESIPESVLPFLEETVYLVARANSVISKKCICFQLYHDDRSLMEKICSTGNVLFCVAKQQIGKYPTIITDNPEKAYADMCNAYIERSNASVIAITGSIGKTTTKKMVQCVYATSGKVHCAADNTNLLNAAGYLGQHIAKDTDYFIQECSEDTYGYMSYFSRCLKPNIAIITTIDKSHIELFEREDDIKRECFSLTDYMKAEDVVITNADDNDLSFYHGKARLVTVSIGNRNTNYWADTIQKTQDGLSFCIHDSKNQVFQINLTSVYSVHTIYSALYAFAAGIESGIDSSQIVQGIENYRTKGIRNNIFKDGRYLVYADCFNANGKSVKSAIETMNDFPVSGRRIAVLGDIAETGKAAEAIHNEIVQEIFASNIDVLLAFGENLNSALKKNPAFRDDLIVVECRSHDDINMYLKSHIRDGDMVLFKASHASSLERSIKNVFPKGYRAFVEREEREILRWRISIRFR